MWSAGPPGTVVLLPTPQKVWDVEGCPCRWEGNDGAYVPVTRSQVAASAGGWAPRGLRRSGEGRGCGRPATGPRGEVVFVISWVF